jgi:protein tyrosine phosphatase (PTP) superfamily phosphohydrolase (DUF442 family)
MIWKTEEISKITPMKIETDSISKLFQFDHFFFSNALSSEGFLELKKYNIQAVVDFRKPHEAAEDDAEEASKVGATYDNCPVSSRLAITCDSLEEADSVIMNKAKTNILLYCASGNRAAAWFAAHLNKHYDISIEESVQLAKSVGLDKEQTEFALRDFFSNL